MRRREAARGPAPRLPVGLGWARVRLDLASWWRFSVSLPGDSQRHARVRSLFLRYVDERGC